jgi:hypothetical protein
MISVTLVIYVCLVSSGVCGAHPIGDVPGNVCLHNGRAVAEAWVSDNPYWRLDERRDPPFACVTPGRPT